MRKLILVFNLCLVSFVFAQKEHQFGKKNEAKHKHVQESTRKSLEIFSRQSNDSSKLPIEYVKGEILVYFKHKQQTIKRNTSSYVPFKNENLEELHNEFEVVKYENYLNDKQSYYIKFKDKNLDLDLVVNKYRATNLFANVDFNYIVKGFGLKSTRTSNFNPNDEKYNIQWALKNNGNLTAFAKAGADIDMEPAWDIEKGNPNLIVAIVDTGLKIDHPEFAGRIWKNNNEIPNNGVDDDNNGYIDDVEGWNVAYRNNDVRDDQGHGTNCGGIAMASNNNGIGYAGVNGESKVMVVKVLDSQNRGGSAWFAEGIRYAVDNGAKVINLSLGGPQDDYQLKKAVNYAYSKGAILLVATGNDNIIQKMYPAAYNNVIAVGATSLDDTRCMPYNRMHGGSGGSNYGDHVDIVAPGDYMYGLAFNSNYNYNGWYSGTSQAAPIVTGIVSLMLSINPDLNFNQVKNILETTAEDQVGRSSEDKNGFDIYHGWGRVNAYQALLKTKKTLNANTPDTDSDGIADGDDNCKNTANTDQADLDNDGIGDVCDTDIDGDGILNTKDCKPKDKKIKGKKTYFKGVDNDSDGYFGSFEKMTVCVKPYNYQDTKPDITDCNDYNKNINPSASEIANNGIDENCDGEDYTIPDADNDGILDSDDNCVNASNANQSDIDNDGIGDVCDVDIDGDGILNAEDCKPKDKNIKGKKTYFKGVDNDSDGYFGSFEKVTVCVKPYNYQDTKPDITDCNDYNKNINPSSSEIANNGIDENCDGKDNQTNTGAPIDDADKDGIADSVDNCPYISNPDQLDANNDGVGDVCKTGNKPSAILKIPQAFSPNGDNKRDFWVINTGNSDVIISVKIFNRNGRLVYKSDKYQNDFNGLDFNGRKLAVGSYVYVINYTDGTDVKTIQKWLYIKY